MRLSPRQQLILLGIATDLAHFRSLEPRFSPGNLIFVRERMSIDDALAGHVKTDPASWLHKGLTPSDHVMLSRDYKRLELLGLIERHSLGYSGIRTTHLSLTDAGREMAEQISKPAEPVKRNDGKKSAWATPILALAAAIKRSASATSGRRLRSSDGNPAGMTGGVASHDLGSILKLEAATPQRTAIAFSNWDRRR